MSMQTRFQTCGAGLRLDAGATLPGEAIDIWRRENDKWTMWTRDASGASVYLESLTIENIHAMREWATDCLVELGHERRVTVAVPA